MGTLGLTKFESWSLKFLSYALDSRNRKQKFVMSTKWACKTGLIGKVPCQVCSFSAHEFILREREGGLWGLHLFTFLSSQYR
jgi:hypothetical protein